MPQLTIQQALAHALDQHRTGQLTDAERVYGRILAQQPRHADALHLLGMLLYQTGRHEAAIGLIKQAIAASPIQPVFHSNLGLILAATGRWDPAVAAHRRSLELNPHSAEAMNNLGIALHAIGKTNEATTWLERALAIQPDYIDARNNLAHLCKLQGKQAAAEKRIDDAVRFYNSAIELIPTDAEALHLLGSLLHESGQSAAAVAPLRRSLEIFPRSAPALNNLGNALFAVGSLQESLDCYRRALEIDPDFPQACNNLGNVLKAAGRIEEAIAAYSRAVALQPASPEPYSNLGNLLREAGQRELAMQSYSAALAIDPHHALTHNNLANAHCEAGEWDLAIDGYQRALVIRPDYADAMNNLGTALEEVGRGNEAIALYRQALSIQPTSVSAPWNIALLQLLRGEYEAGWIGYEHRWKQAKQKRSFRNFSEPMLPILVAGQTPDLRGKRVLLHAEQGFGDAIQFCRYASIVADLGAVILLEVPPPLVRLMSSLRGVAEIIPAGTPLPAFDFHCPLMSLPMVFGTTLDTVPNAIPYLAAGPYDVQRWAERFAAEPTGLRVGLAWAGGTNHQKDRQRSLRLADFAVIGQVPGVRFYSLQLGEPAAQTGSLPAGMSLIDWTRDLHDFADTAAMLSHLDLIITVDTSVGHLAGAMGKPVWTLLAFLPDWRWLLDREDSPWYPNTRLFRQKSPKDWSDPLARIEAELPQIQHGRSLSKGLASPG